MNDFSNQIDLKTVTFSPDATIREAIAALDAAGTGALALCNDHGKLLGILSDGDLRRALLSGRSLEDACLAVACTTPVIASSPVTAAHALRVMNEFDIHHLPVVDDQGILVDFLLRKNVVQEYQLEAESSDRLRTVCIAPQASILDAIAHLNEAGTGALMVCDAEGKLRGLITDGDIRRAVIRQIPLSDPCEDIATPRPVCASEPISSSDALRIMNEHDIHQLPLVDGEGRIVDFLLRKDLQSQHDLQAVIMAGGYGKRLLPLTEKVPKPMLPVGERPLLELIIQQLRKAGIHDVNLTTHYLPDSISGHFGNGEHFGVRLNYSREENPLGTAGGLRLMARPQGPFLVINGDILTGVPFQQMLQYHRAHRAMLTVGVRKYEVQVPFGVVDCDDVRITNIEEKPCHSYFINAGTYILEPAAWDRIPEGSRFDMTDLMRALLDAGETIVGFPIMEYWIDVGRHEDYMKAQDLVSKGEL